MTVTFPCGRCGQRYTVNASLAGRKIRCQKCQAVVTIPAASGAATSPAPSGPKPALQTFGAANPGRPPAPPPPLPRAEPTDVFGLDDAESSADPYALEEPYAPPMAPMKDEAEPGLSRPGATKAKKKRAPDYGGFWRRLGALVVDTFVLFGLGIILVLFLFLVLRSSGRPPTDPAVGLGFQLLGFLLGVLYFAASHSSSSQATSGKKTLGLIVTDLHGQRISFGRSLLREVVKQVLGMICLGTIASLFTIIFTPKKQALHDLIVGTVVVRSR